jgi:hypothetical protein
VPHVRLSVRGPKKTGKAHHSFLRNRTSLYEGFETRFLAMLPGVFGALSISSSRRSRTHLLIASREEKAGSTPAYFSNGFFKLGGICRYLPCPNSRPFLTTPLAYLFPICILPSLSNSSVQAWRILHIEWRVLHIESQPNSLHLTYVQRESLLRHQRDIARFVHYHRAARSNPERRTNRGSLLRNLPLRPPPDSQ